MLSQSSVILTEQMLPTNTKLPRTAVRTIAPQKSGHKKWVHLSCIAWGKVGLETRTSRLQPTRTGLMELRQLRMWTKLLATKLKGLGLDKQGLRVLWEQAREMDWSSIRRPTTMTTSMELIWRKWIASKRFLNSNHSTSEPLYIQCFIIITRSIKLMNK